MKRKRVVCVGRSFSRLRLGKGETNASLQFATTQSAFRNPHSHFTQFPLRPFPASLYPRQLTQIGLHHGLGTTPDHEEKRLAAPTADGVVGEVTGALGGG